MTLNRVQLSVVVAGCAAGLLLAVVGAARAAETPDVAPLEKGDRIAAEASGVPSLTVEEVNLDIGVSNLIRIERHKAQP